MKHYFFFLLCIALLAGCEKVPPLDLARFEGKYDVQVSRSEYQPGTPTWENTLYYDTLRLAQVTDSSAIVQNFDRTVNFVRYDTIKHHYIYEQEDEFHFWHCKLTLDLRDDSVFVYYLGKAGVIGTVIYTMRGKR